MRSKLIACLAAAAVLATGAFAAVGLAGEEPGAPSAAALVDGYRSAGGETLHRVAAPSADANRAAVAQARAKARRPRIEYFETDPFPIADGQGIGDPLTCPGSRRVLGGYFGSDGIDVALTFSAPDNNRTWFVGVTNFPGFTENAATQAFTGIVCAKGVR